MQDDRPVFLWAFEAGDRADGGLRSIYGQNGELVIELEGKDKVIGKDLYRADDTSHGVAVKLGGKAVNKSAAAPLSFWELSI